jgi:hypothetical protein
LDALTLTFSFFVYFRALKYKLPRNNKQISFKLLVPVSKPSMAATGGGGVGGNVVGGAGGAGGQVPLCGIFSNVAARYAPLVLSVPLHDLPENYMKNIPKFTGEGDLTAQEHINFFDQFVDILGLEQEDVYSRLLVQNFEGQVRT